MSINVSQYFGVRFHLEHDTVITAVGGHLLNYGFLADDTFTAFIVSLQSHSALPMGSPLADEEIVASAPCRLIDNFSRDYVFPMAATLPAGHYALVFGGGTVNAAMPGNDELTPNASYMVWSIEGWRDASRQFGRGVRSVPDYHFVLYGTVLR